MDQYLFQLRDYFVAHPPDFGDGDAESILDMLHWHYAEHNPFYNQTIKEGYRQLDAYLMFGSHDPGEKASGLSVKSWRAENGVSENTYYYRL